MQQARRYSLVHMLLLVAALVAIALVTPVLDNPRGLMSSLTHITFDDVIVAIILAVSLNLILGMTGQFSLGHAGFLAVGAYGAAVVAGKAEFFVPQLVFWHHYVGLSVPASFTCIAVAAMVVSMVVASICGLIVGLPTLRLRGDYLAIATLGFGEIVATLIANSEYLERTFGLRLDSMRRQWSTEVLKTDRENALALAVREYNNNVDYFLSSFWILGAALLTVWIIRNIKYSTFGRGLLAVREDVVASEAVGIPTTRYKVSAFVIGAALAGLAGAIVAHYGALSPNTFRFMYSVTIVLFIILGGQGSITGSVLAAVLLTVLPVLLQRNTLIDPNLTEKYRMVAYALLIILSTLFMRRGLFGRYEITDLASWAWQRGPRRARAAVAEVPPGTATLIAEEVLETPDMPLLHVAHVTMHFGGLRAVDDFSLTLMPGELVGLIGPNGAGKTTVFNVLTGVYRPTAGSIAVSLPAGAASGLLAGRGAREHGGTTRSVVGSKPHAISRMGIARTFQNIRLFANLSVVDNVQIAQHAHHKQGVPAVIVRTPAFFREEEASRHRALGYLALFDLAHLAHERAASLSYGDQRRLEIARALATRPRLLLLDEPAAGMNPTEKRELMELIRSLRPRFGLTVLLIEHDMKVIMGVCQRILVLDYGKTIASGTPEEIRKNPAVIEAYLGASAKQEYPTD